MIRSHGVRQLVGAVAGVLLVAGGCQQQAETGKAKSAILVDIPVTAVPVKREALALAFSFVGTIDANNVVEVAAETEGRVESVLVEVGDTVKAGQVLVQVDDELKQAQFNAAEVSHAVAGGELRRQEALYEEGSVPIAALEERRLAAKQAEVGLANARRALENTRITSPIAGVVDSRPVNVGTMVGQHMPVATVVDISTLKVLIRVPEREAFRLQVGDPVEISTEIYPEVKFAGKVANIGLQADAAHTYRVEIRMPNDPRHPLRAGLFARVRLGAQTPAPVLAIPRAALVGSIKDPQVYVVAQGRAHRRGISLGEGAGDRLAVLAGLEEGEMVVTSGQNNLSEGAAVALLNPQE